MFNLPKSTVVQKVIPKNSFDDYTNTKQKKTFSERVSRIVWANKISQDTINITGKEVQEIQIFEIELKEKLNIKDLLIIIDKAIPYHIIFKIKFNDEYYISTSAKHIHPTNDDNAVIDYTFSTEWMSQNETGFYLELKNNLDWIYKNFCSQFAANTDESINLKELVENEKKLDEIKKDIEKVKLEISRCKQFNKKVELNLSLKKMENKMRTYIKLN
ncbi:DUF4391 domain-containing protein [Chryseobacterium sp. 5_R23647]|uniref:DUF4391 domain-containing protein n=1 Tax=Chryseobacterium sp. 5_R23647 TaxID=2258964 RepID=UPI000E283B50|nr:DUF4391 domain-containing protein [Chryseobacterium sp. 5_R23647]REC40770.1 DUF4391 domain-containing protein [Chryseobacterium sp. 5_R23647]